ncbi:MAG: HD domain-containing protein, partial [Clostridiales bacterium]
MNDIIKWSQQEADKLLKDLPIRLKHVKGVVKQAYRVGQIFNENEKNILIETAYLHDIGYAVSLNKTGFHPLDGAVFIKNNGLDRVASLVAYHTGALFEARLRNLEDELVKFEKEDSLLADALNYCDMTTSSTGELITFEERING